MTHPTDDPLRDPVEMMEVETRLILAEFFRRGVSKEKWEDAPHLAARKVRAALAAAPQPAPDAFALGQALYHAVHYAAERGDVGNLDIVLRPLWEWHVAFVQPGIAIPEDIRALPIPQPAPAPADEREAMIAVMRKAFLDFGASGGRLRSGAVEFAADALLADGWTRGGDAAGLREALDRIRDVLVDHTQLHSHRINRVFDILDAIPARPSAPETLAWAVVGEDGRVNADTVCLRKDETEMICDPEARVVRVAIRRLGDEA